MVERIIHRRTKTSSTNSREQVKYTSIPDIHFGPAFTTIGTIQYALHSYILNGLSEQHSQVIHAIKATKKRSRRPTLCMGSRYVTRSHAVDLACDLVSNEASDGCSASLGPRVRLAHLHWRLRQMQTPLFGEPSRRLAAQT